MTPTDPVTFGASCLLLLGVALLACYVPARRANRIDAATALRQDARSRSSLGSTIRSGRRGAEAPRYIASSTSRG